jgi:hypothetical protein
MTEADWMRVWQNNTPAAADPEKVARAIMAQTWRFDQKIFWRNAREYAAGIVLLVVFAVQFGMGHDRIGALIGIVAVGFVMAYLWWKHRDLRPLDPAADVASYRAALLARIDDQIRLLRSVPYWYLLPLCFQPIWMAWRGWRDRHAVAGAVIMLLGVFGAFAFVGWLNVVWGTRTLRARRDKIESTYPKE